MKQYPFKSFWKRALAGCFDAVGRALSFPLRSRRKPLDLAAARSILVIRLDHIGDVVMSRPAIRALHKKFPHAAIDLLVTEDIAPLFEPSKEIRTVIAAKHGWFNRNASFVQKCSEFWKLAGMLRGQAFSDDALRGQTVNECLSPKSADVTPRGQAINQCLSPKDDPKTGPYDIGIDLRGDLRNILLMSLAGVKHTIGYGIAGGGFLLDEEVPYDATQHQVWLNLNLLNSFHVAQDNKLLPFEYSPDRTREFWKKIKTPPPTTLLPRVAIHMGSGYPSKRWPSGNFQTLIQEIDRKMLAQIVLIGTEAERDATPDFRSQEPHDANPSQPRATSYGGNDMLLETLNSERLIDLRGKTALQDLPGLLDVCDVFIGSDSGPAHIAAAQGLEIILLVSGTNDIRLWYPWTERLTLLQHEVPCSPCGLETCPVEGHPCVEEITVDQALNALLSVLGRLQKKS